MSRTARVAFLLAVCACARAASRDHTPPQAAFAAYPSTGAAPLAVRFDGTASRDDICVAAWQWDFGDGQSASGSIADHTYTSRGAYVAKLTATDAAGNSSQTTKMIEVTAPDDVSPPHASFTPSATSGVAPVTLHFDGSASSDDTGITSFAWDFGDGSAATGAAVDHAFASAGNFTVRLTVRDAAGNSDSARAAIAISAPAIDGARPRSWPHTSNVTTGAPRAGSFRCPAADQGNSCRECRECWDAGRADISYRLH